MDNEILVIQKTELKELLEYHSGNILRKLNAQLQNAEKSKGKPEDYFRLYNSRSIKKLLDISNSSFEKLQHELPLHKSNTGRCLILK